jgi:hypothetical protein
VRPLWLHMFPPAHAPGLSFVGLSWRAIRPPQFQLQARLAARALSGAAALPTQAEMAAAAAADLEALDAAGIPRRYAHCMAAFMPRPEWEYASELVAAANAGPSATGGGAAAGGEGDAAGGGAGGEAAFDPVALGVPRWLHDLAEATDFEILRRPDTFRDAFTPEGEAAAAAAHEACLELLRAANAALGLVVGGGGGGGGGDGAVNAAPPAKAAKAAAPGPPVALGGAAAAAEGLAR